ncbi:hypothetical protein [Archangium lipolyticum]|uniref:hypothetical protein n=1 Tax=Archangium lipolyticum TaxID=2970465 RepID=UPI00214A1946|nr:hypothetical protein [Archangium lipolyticum]
MATPIRNNDAAQALAAARAAEAERKAAEAARQAAEAVRQREAMRPAPASTARSTFEAAPETVSRQPDLSGGTSTAGSTLLTENTRDARVNCLDLVGDELARNPELRDTCQVVFLDDTRSGAEGITGHVVLQRGGEIWDPNSGQWMKAANWLQQNPQYQPAARAPAGAIHDILSATPGAAREQAIARSGVDPSLLNMLVADTTATQAASPAGQLSPATRAAMDAYIADPSEANLDALVRALATEQVGETHEALQAALTRLEGATSPTAFANLVNAAVESQELSKLILGAPTAYAQMETDFPVLQSFAAARDPRWNGTDMRQLLADPALFQSFMQDAMAGFRAGETNPLLANREAPPVEFQRFQSGQALLGGLPADVPLEQALASAEQRLLELQQQHPELAVLNPQELIEAFVPPDAVPGLRFDASGGTLQVRGSLMLPPSGQLDAMDGTNGTYILAQHVASNRGATAPFLETLRDNVSQLETLSTRLATDPPSARELLPVAGWALQLLGQELMANPSAETQLAFETAFTTAQGYLQDRQTRAVAEAGVAILGVVASVAGTFATGGVAAGFIATSILANSVQAGLSVDSYLNAQRLSQYSGGGLDLSGVPAPNGGLFALEMALNAVGVVGDFQALGRALGSTARAGQAAAEVGQVLLPVSDSIRVLAGATDEILAELAVNGQRFENLSEAARGFLSQWVRSPEHYAQAWGLPLEAAQEVNARMFRVFQQGPLQGRSVTDLYKAGAISANDYVLWNSRTSSVLDASTIVMLDDPKLKALLAARKKELITLGKTVAVEADAAGRLTMAGGQVVDVSRLQRYAQSEGLTLEFLKDPTGKMIASLTREGKLIGTLKWNLSEKGVLNAHFDLHDVSARLMQSMYETLTGIIKTTNPSKLEFVTNSKVGRWLQAVGFNVMPELSNPEASVYILELAQNPDWVDQFGTWADVVRAVRNMRTPPQ